MDGQRGGEAPAAVLGVLGMLLVVVVVAVMVVAVALTWFPGADDSAPTGPVPLPVLVDDASS